jgi:hypothetical protein
LGGRLLPRPPRLLEHDPLRLLFGSPPGGVLLFDPLPHAAFHFPLYCELPLCLLDSLAQLRQFPLLLFNLRLQVDDGRRGFLLEPLLGFLLEPLLGFLPARGNGLPGLVIRRNGLRKGGGGQEETDEERLGHITSILTFPSVP